MHPQNESNPPQTHHSHHSAASADPRYRDALWWALAANALMFLVEVVAGWSAASASLLADAIDFAGDAANYGLAIWAIGVGAMWRARTAWIKGASMLTFGVLVLMKAGWLAWTQSVPEAQTMGAVSVLALTVNVGVAVLLFRWREGDATMQSVWLCTRNDAIANLVVLGAAGMVWATGSGWPDVVVAAFIGSLALQSGLRVLSLARRELRRLQP